MVWLSQLKGCIKHDGKNSLDRIGKNTQANGYLEIIDKGRVHLWHIWHKVCATQAWSFLVLIKEKDTASIYKVEELIGAFEIRMAKIKIKELAQANTR
ncbi:MAG: hypothetical protein ACI9FR_001521 [Cryomorphaceae bacterium]